MICAIHQPNFFPWLGYFRKIARSDTFIFLDHVQFPRTSRGTWTNRVKLIVAGEERWVTCPIRRNQGTLQNITDIQIDDDQSWQDAMSKTIHVNYALAPHFSTVIDIVDQMIFLNNSNLSQYNMINVKKIAKILNIETNFLISSEFKNIYSPSCSSSEHKGSDLLANLCHTVGADIYLAGGGADGYENQESYALANIKLMHNQYTAEPYYQTVNGDCFVAGLSVLDALFNIGLDGVRNLIVNT